MPKIYVMYANCPPMPLICFTKEEMFKCETWIMRLALSDMN